MLALRSGRLGGLTVRLAYVRELRRSDMGIPIESRGAFLKTSTSGANAFLSPADNFLSSSPCTRPSSGCTTPSPRPRSRPVISCCGSTPRTAASLYDLVFDSALSERLFCSLDLVAPRARLKPELERRLRAVEERQHRSNAVAQTIRHYLDDHKDIDLEELRSFIQAALVRAF